jgi:hypothetical protein
MSTALHAIATVALVVFSLVVIRVVFGRWE